MFYQHNLEYVESAFSQSEKERLSELSKVIYTREKHITQTELYKLLDFSENCIYKNLRTLKSKEIIEIIGSNKKGY